MTWVPRAVDIASREALFEGIPSHIRPSLMEWLRRHLTSSSYGGPRYFDMAEIHAFDLAARMDPPLSTRIATNKRWPGVLVELPDEELLDLVDWIAHRDYVGANKELARILEAGSSAWTLGTRNGNRGLVRRVSPAVQMALDEATASETAGALLSEAWVACYGRAPNPEEAYEKAIKAVEEAGASIVSPKNTRATLGSMIRDMKNQGAWRIDLPGAAQDVPVSMMEALWTGQESRHGGNGYRMPTQSEAEAAVLLAVPLVQWFMSGNVKRRSQAA